MTDLTDGSAQVEKRREQRYHVFWRAQLHLPGGQRLDARVRDISSTGLGLTVDAPLPVRAVLPITIGIPDATRPGEVFAVPCKLSVLNVVLSVDEYRVGGVWVDLTGDAAKIIDQWIRRLRLSSYAYDTAARLL
jgi:hypothetical protein